MRSHERYRSAPWRSPRRRQAGQTITEYVIVAGILALMLFAPLPGADRSVITLLIQAFKNAWEAYSYTISFPW